MTMRHTVGAALLAAGLASVGSVGRLEASVEFPAPVEAWRSRIEKKAAGTALPIDFLLNWVRYESYGNPCALGVPGHEAGIAQTWHRDDDRFGATYDDLRAACVPDKQELARPLTPEEKDLQVTSLVGLVKSARDAARAQIARAGVTWSESSPDFWMLVKLRHALPAWGADYLVPCAKDLGHPPATFAEFREWIEGLSEEQVIAINRNVKPFASMAQRRRLFDNAEKTGRVVGESSE
jgi:hypothetical protein